MIDLFHSELSKAKNGSVLASVTGGSWKKSPVMTSCEAYVSCLNQGFGWSGRTCMPPNGRSVLRRRCATSERVSNKCPSTIETGPVYSYIPREEPRRSPSSMINTLVAFHRLSAGLHLRMCLMWLSKSSCFGAIAPQEWMVIPGEPNRGADP